MPEATSAAVVSKPYVVVMVKSLPESPYRSGCPRV
jgi:hypothetical protein